MRGWGSARQITHLGQNSVKRSRVISIPITLRTVVLHADKLVGSIAPILRMRGSKYSPRVIKQDRRLLRRCDVLLCKGSRAASASVHVPLCPGRDCRRSTSQHNSTTDDTNCYRDIVKFDVIQHKRSGESAVAGFRCSEEDRSIGYYAIYNDLASHGPQYELSVAVGKELDIVHTWVDGITPPVVRSNPTWQLLIVTPWNVHPTTTH